MKQLKQSRNDLFASLDRPALKGLPSERPDRLGVGTGTVQRIRVGWRPDELHCTPEVGERGSAL
jgi:hypothetical protein